MTLAELNLNLGFCQTRNISSRNLWLILIKFSKSLTLGVSFKTRNQPKPAKTNQNLSHPTKTSQNYQQTTETSHSQTTKNMYKHLKFIIQIFHSQSFNVSDILLILCNEIFQRKKRQILYYTTFTKKHPIKITKMYIVKKEQTLLILIRLSFRFYNH